MAINNDNWVVQAAGNGVSGQGLMLQLTRGET
jgi:hypothetical protein